MPATTCDKEKGWYQGVEVKHQELTKALGEKVQAEGVEEHIGDLPHWACAIPSAIEQVP